MNFEMINDFQHKCNDLPACADNFLRLCLELIFYHECVTNWNIEIDAINHRRLSEIIISYPANDPGFLNVIGLTGQKGKQVS